MDQHHSDVVNEISPFSTQSSARLKRRSLLPQPGTAKSIHRSVTLSEAPRDRVNDSQPSMSADELPKPATSIPLARGTSVTGSRLGRLRPRSTYQTGSAPADKRTEPEKPTASQSMRPPSLLSKPSATPSLGFGRTQSLRRPAAVAQSDLSASNMSHSRTQSTSTVPLARSNTTKPRITAERPKSVHIPSGTIAQANSNSIQPESAITRTSTRLAGMGRSASVRTRPDGASGESGPPQAKAKEPVKEEPKKAARPAFSTLQQHFTPRKASKAPTATFLHPAPVATSNSLPPELVNLQMDLLQLHLLHESAAEISRHWEMSVKRGLRRKFDEVASMYQVMLEHERSGQEQKNLQALLEWTGDKTSASLVEHIQVLSGPLHKLPSLVQTGGRFQRHVGAFEQWVSWVEEVRAARQRRYEGGLRSIEGLGDAWKAENAALMRILTSFARELSGLSQPTAGSTIASIVGCCESLLDGLLEELRVIRTIEADVVSKEKKWVETRLQGIAADIGSFLVDDAPAWRI
ncbi:hypothetical protein BU25DRAFT_329522 [Macroventuria anomochaeta]|uniref:Uncharacterized protein n=1 Tax=Macroventuria anomochaeta TaxID=301207 RepID=A0ACB6SGR5_9PLEO|nr:uncharacterized protein BU25DRAFT_329522 [Macroventuria anomochaeta]KAF2632667.1 hypothetical protein BU25DRAFT_329522 [Macroventuria anomochaeta]